MAGRAACRAVVLAAAAWSGGCGGTSAPVVTPFRPADCRGQLIELVRFPQTYPVTAVATVANDLVLDGDTLFMDYAFATSNGALSPAGGIVAIPLSGGTPRVIAAADPARTSEWLSDSFWADAGQLYIQTGTTLASVPEDAPSPTPLPVVIPDAAGAGLYSAYAHDAAFGYFAHGEIGQHGITVQKVPIDGGDPTLLVQESLPDVVVGGMADAGDALLLHLRWRDAPYSGATYTRVWRIAKDGSGRTDVRPDVTWEDPLDYPWWLAWDGENVLGPLLVQNNIVQARVAPTGTSQPQQLKLGGGVATRRGGEILNVQPLFMATDASGPLIVASSRGDAAGTVLACGGELPFPEAVLPVGIAANDDDIFVAYHAGQDLVVARVAP